MLLDAIPSVAKMNSAIFVAFCSFASNEIFLRVTLRRCESVRSANKGSEKNGYHHNDFSTVGRVQAARHIRIQMKRHAVPASRPKHVQS